MRAPVLLPSEPREPHGMTLDEAQARVVAWRGPGMCVVLGSPGTGATTALTHAAAARLGEVDASQVLVIGRDRDGVRRLRAGIAALTRGGALPTATTFHGLAYALVRRYVQGDADGVLPRLLSGAEEDVRIRDLLRGAIDDGDLPWPDDLLAATATLGFANDLRALLARARELQMSPRQMDVLAERSTIPAWASLGRLAQMESEVMALEGVVDYTRLLEMATEAATSWPGDLRYIYVDEFHEAGPLQRHLLQALSTASTATMVAADPDIAAFAFRGADRQGALHLIDSAGADVIVLDRIHSGGGDIRRAYERARRHPAMPGLRAEIIRAYRHPMPEADPPVTHVDVVSHDSWSDMAAWVADDLRRRHLGLTGESVPWDSMAIIARSTTQLDSVRRALDSVGVPVSVDAADIPLQREPAVAVLLAAVTAALAPQEMSPRTAVDLVTGPLIGLDSADVRVLARALRARSRSRHPGSAVPAGTQLLCDELAAAALGSPVDEEFLDSRARVVHDRVMSAGALLHAIRARAEAGAPPGEVVWEAWSGARGDGESDAWPQRLRRAALAGHAPSSHDIDAVMALLATAERLSDRYAGVVGIRGLLAALHGQRVPAERVSHHHAGSPAVSLLTAHRAVGRSWDHVVIMGAQEGVWPPALGGSSVLRLVEWESLAQGAHPVGAASALRDAAAERLGQERRLFALAVSRARVTLTVATVDSDGDDQPSRFLDDIDVALQRRPGRPPRPLTLDGLVARLRSTAQDPAASQDLRTAAIDRLAALADATDDAGASLAPRADPATWWGVADVTPGVSPMRPANRPVTVSGSGLAALRGCPLRWFLGRVVHAEGPRGRAMAIGNIVHVLAERAARGDIAAEPSSLLTEVDRVWAELAFDTSWEADAERDDVAAALGRLCAYLQGSPRRMLAVEQDFLVTIPLHTPIEATGDTEYVARGAIDRIEIDADGRVHLIDFKTARRPPTGPEVSMDPQLGLYQQAVRHGALADVDADADCAGAALVQLRCDERGSAGEPRVQEQAELGMGPVPWMDDDVTAAIVRIRSEDFPAIPSSECRNCPYRVACPAQSEGREVSR